jgi:Rhodopirellula transposase DDE domain
VEEARGAWPIPCGRAYQPRDCSVETLAATWEALAEPAQAEPQLIQRQRDHGPASRGRRPPWLARLGQRADRSNKPMQRLYSPPYPSPYHPMERGWGLLAWPGHGTKRLEAETRLGWAKPRTWKGRHPLVALRHNMYQKGLALGKAAMQGVAARLQRDPHLPKYAIWINPAPTS